MEINQILNNSLENLNAEFFEGEIDFDRQNVRQIFTNKIIQECRDIEIGNRNVHSVKISKSGLLSQHIKICRFEYEKIVQETWETSDLKEFIDRGFCIFLYTDMENSHEKDVFSGVLKFFLTDEESSYVQRVWSVTQNTVANGEILKSINPLKTNWIGQSRQLFVHVRPDARNNLDTFRLPIVDKLSGKNEYTKHAFWLNKKVIENKLNDL